MIDDPSTVGRLMEQMQSHLPIPALPSKEVARTLRRAGVRVSVNHALSVKRVFYLGDEGGIACDVTPGQDAKEVFVVSLTHLRLTPTHPLFRPVRAYQLERVRGIAVSGYAP